MEIWINGEKMTFPSGSNGSGGNPIGTIISFMGTKAPKGYLVCDGSSCSRNDYPALAQFFKDQFGSEDFFGDSSDSTKFHVPDLRNLFLRGYHGDSEQQLSGEIGVKQEGTEFPYTATNKTDRDLYYFPSNRDVTEPINLDRVVETRSSGYSKANQHANIPNDISSDPVLFTSRPVNMAVLYCIKAEDVSSNDSYSEEEQIVGTWFGKPLYRKSRVFDVGKLPVVGKEGTLTLLTNELSGKIPVRMQSLYHLSSPEYDYEAYFDAGVNSIWNDGVVYRFTASFENGNLILQYRWTTSTYLKIYHSYEYIKTSD